MTEGNIEVKADKKRRGVKLAEVRSIVSKYRSNKIRNEYEFSNKLSND